MKIQQQQTNGISTDRSDRAGQTGRVGSDSGLEGSRARQHGLDRVDVSRVGETAARIVENSLQTREAHVSKLAKQVQSGNYGVNLASLSNSILDHDLEPDAAYAR